MKAISLLMLLVVSINLCAMPRMPHRSVRRMKRIQIVRPVKIKYPSWKTITAGGAAFGTVVMAYKVGNGVEEGMKTVAKEHPEEFSRSPSVLTWPLRWGLLILMCVSGWWLWRKLGNKNNK